MPKPYDHSKWEMENPKDWAWRLMTLVGYAALLIGKFKAWREDR